MALSNRACYHRWSSSGKCVSPGCWAVRGKEEVTGRPAPLSLDLDQRGAVIELLPALSNAAIAARVGVSAKTVAKIRRQESQA